ncbi:serine acetyltransferase [Cytobacillus depressus]|uniref:Serine acetyltransferase n=1 Tax=Cytobacillus depressus TaxID=1602942 RepID=A0A6L3V833_9BACI|nr:serine acetyltransferase [Cytobacillus depressus]KAB2337592.1 serine acetyltransferase [Cytobacillus depressus]
MEQDRLLNVYKNLVENYQRHTKLQNCPTSIDLTLVPDFVDVLIKTLLPEYFYSNLDNSLTLNNLTTLQRQVKQLMSYIDDPELIQDKSFEILEKVPALRIKVLKDVEAAYLKDPAAKSYEEIVLTYPGIFSIIVHRISHEFYKMGFSLIARSISEHSHSKTGIDIHPGATIGHSFFMDHGTGIVIGETTVIRNNVTIYQGVTLGAFSFDRDKNGEIIKDGKRRHPVIEDNVTVYAGATILGGETIVGKDSIVGGNVWLTKSIPAGSKVVSEIQNRII